MMEQQKIKEKYRFRFRSNIKEPLEFECSLLCKEVTSLCTLENKLSLGKPNALVFLTAKRYTTQG